MIIKNIENNLLKLCLIIIILIIYNFTNIYYYYKYHEKTNNKIAKPIEDYLKIFIMAHKDFNNTRYNHIYNIVVDDKTSLKNRYNLNIIYANEGKLHNMN